MTAENRINTSLLFFFALLFINTFAYGQTTKNIPFIDVVEKLEQSFDVKFSYDSTKAKEITVDEPDYFSSLSEILKTITTTTQIKFTTIDSRYITVVFPEIYIAICGSIIETSTGAPANDISILYNLKEEQLSKSSTFSIEKIKDDSVIEIYREDVLLKTIIAKQLITADSKCPIIFIDENLNYLPTVTLESYIVKGISKNIDGTVTITNKDFEILPSLIEPDVLQIAQVLPGVSSFDETASNINIRGGESDETLILWNDIRMYQTGHFFGLISAFNPNLIKRMTIYKNGTHPAYGEGVSGTLAMESTNTVTEDFEGGVGVNFSSLNAFGKIPLSETFALQISGRTSINSGVGNPVYKQFFARTFQNTSITNLDSNTTFGVRSTDEDFSFYDIGVSVIWDITKRDKITYNFMTISNQLQFTERFVAADSSQASTNRLRQRTLLGGFTHTRNWNNNLKTSTSYSSSTYVFNGNNAQNELIDTQSQSNEVKEKSVRFKISYKINDAIEFDGGYQYVETKVNDNDNAVINPNNTSNATIANSYFGNSTVQLNDNNTTFNAGLRWINYSNFDARFEPRITAHHKFSKALQIFAAAELKSQTVYQFTARENQLLQLENDRWIVANDEDNPVLESTQYSFGGSYSTSNWMLMAEGFYKKVDGINTQNLGFRNQLQNVSAIGRYDSKGVEFSVNKKFTTFSTWLSYTFMDNTYTFDSLTPKTFRGNFDVAHAITAAVNYTWKSIQLSGGLNYHSGLPYTTPLNDSAISTLNNVSVIDYNEPNNATLENYFRTDISAKYSFKIDETFSGNFNLALLNIFDQQTRLSSYYQTRTNANGDSSINRVDQFSLGFTPNISFQLFF